MRVDEILELSVAKLELQASISLKVRALFGHKFRDCHR